MGTEPSQLLNHKFEHIEKDLQDVTKTVEELRKPRKKDTWDKLSSLTGVTVALVGGLFSFLYNHYQSQREEIAKSNQAELQKIETVSKFMVYLAGNDERARTVALFEVQHILDTKA